MSFPSHHLSFKRKPPHIPYLLPNREMPMGATWRQSCVLQPAARMLRTSVMRGCDKRRAVVHDWRGRCYNRRRDLLLPSKETATTGYRESFNPATAHRQSCNRQKKKLQPLHRKLQPGHRATSKSFNQGHRATRKAATVERKSFNRLHRKLQPGTAQPTKLQPPKEKASTAIEKASTMAASRRCTRRFLHPHVATAASFATSRRVRPPGSIRVEGCSNGSRPFQQREPAT